MVGSVNATVFETGIKLLLDLDNLSGLSLNKRAKLIDMIDLATPRLTSFAAWPKSLLLDQHDRLIGFIMPRATGIEIMRCFL